MSANQTVWAARTQFAASTSTNMHGVVVQTGPMRFKTQKTKPRKVKDIRHKGLVGLKEVDAAIINYYARWGEPPDVLRVHIAARTNLYREAHKRGLPQSGKHLVFQGVRVTL